MTRRSFSQVLPMAPARPMTPAAVLAGSRPAASPAGEPVALVDLLDRVLARGVVVAGELTLSIAEVDLVHISLRALISSVRPDLFGDSEDRSEPGRSREMGESGEW